MKDRRLKDKLPENRFTSINTLSEGEFSEGIKKAEEGPFYTVQESMTQFESWLKQRKKKVDRMSCHIKGDPSVAFAPSG